ncbi:LysR family transcriptional regulator [Yinghuangia soli]|uniref:LysR family transcriptional regulator n=1 Tax=Yinghuangia soli TaxID=2908204 RepID=A0AA41Q5W8_9ACTN|nr:LysR family transcriptional regulator [Yinghuangia soli]MCF2530742.1 LysR family transcriptional regulator [Yinghuangia soli]
MLDVRRLRLLRELAHRGTIAAVADALAFTPSAVSQQLSALEREAGLPLLERTGRSVALTPAGAALAAHAEAVLARLEEAETDLAARRGAPAGPLRIGTFSSGARSLLPDALARLAAEHPALEPRVAELDPVEAADRLRAGELDVALLHRYDFAPRISVPGVQSRALFTEALHLAEPDSASAGADAGAGDTATTSASASAYAHASRRSAEASVEAPAETPAGASESPLAACRDAAWILATPGTLCHTMTVRACEAAGFTPQARHHVDDFAAVLSMVAAGLGVALVPELGIAHTPAETVRRTRLTRLPLARETQVAYRAGAGRHPAIRAFAEALRATAPPALTPLG